MPHPVPVETAGIEKPPEITRGDNQSEGIEDLVDTPLLFNYTSNSRILGHQLMIYCIRFPEKMPVDARNYVP